MKSIMIRKKGTFDNFSYILWVRRINVSLIECRKPIVGTNEKKDRRRSNEIQKQRNEIVSDKELPVGTLH